MQIDSSLLDELFQGIYGLADVGILAMFVVGFILMFLAVRYEYEPLLLFPMGLGCVLANIPGHYAVLKTPGSEGFLYVLYGAGVANELFPVMIFIAIGAMCEFDPLMRKPFVMLFAAAAQFGIFMTAFLAACLGFPFNQAAAIGIIGAADGPTTIFVASRYAQEMLGPLSVAAYCYMSLVPVIQPPIIKLLTTKKERQIHMPFTGQTPVSDRALFIFPLMIVMVAGIVAPISVPLIGALMFGNLLKVSGCCDALADCAKDDLSNLVTLFLGIVVGSTMTAENFLTFDVFKILCLGAVAFVFDTAGGVIFAKILNIFLPTKINPMIGACGISAFPMSGRVIAKMALKDDPTNFIVQDAIGVNVAGQIASVVAGGLVLCMIPMLTK